MAWYYAKNGQQIGPVSIPDFERLVDAGEITSETLVWQEGMADWRPYADLRPTPPPSPTGDQTVCIECGTPLPKEEMIQYESSWVCAACKPVFFQKVKEGVSTSAAMVWRFKKHLVMGHDAVLPDRCVKCNAPVQGRRLARNLYWHSPVFYFLILINLLVYVLVALIIRKRARIAVGLCQKHQAGRKRDMAIGWLLSLAGIGVIIVSLMSEYWLLLLAAIFLFLGALMYGAVRCRIVYAHRIDKQYVWINGVCREYLDTLP